MKFFQFSHAAKAFTGCDPNYKPKFPDPRPRWEDRRAHYGGSTGTKEADRRTNPERGRRDNEEAREVKEHSTRDSQRWKKVEVQRKRSYAEVLGRRRYQDGLNIGAGTEEHQGAGRQVQDNTRNQVQGQDDG